MNKTPASLLLLLALAPTVLAQEAKPASAAATPAPAAEPDKPAPKSAMLTMDFRGAKLGKILDYLSREAGYILINPVDLPTPVTLVSKQPLSPAEAVDALNAVLFDQGYTVLTRGRTLRVVPLAQAKQLNIPVNAGGDPAAIPESDHMVTQVIPVHSGSVKSLADNLQPLLNTAYSTLSANESSNTLILTDTQTNVRRIAAIVHAIDSSISNEQQVKVFHLAHASSDKIAQVLTSIYTPKVAAGNAQGGGIFSLNGGGRGGRGGGGDAGGKDKDDAGHADQVTVASDPGTNSVVVRASPVSLTLIDDIIKQLDLDTTAREGIFVYAVHNAKSADLAQSLTTLLSAVANNTGGSGTGVQNRQVPGGGVVMAPSAATAVGGDAALDLTGQVRVVSHDLSNSVLVLTSERNFDRLKKTLTELDRPMRQVLVRVLMAEVSVENDLNLGVEWQVFNPSTTPNGAANHTYSSFQNLFAPATSLSGLNSLVVDNSHLQVALNALAVSSKFDVIARPYILTTDNQKAVVNVSQTVPLITGTRTDVNNNVTVTTTPTDVGIILTITPQISSDGHVVLSVDQLNSAIATNQGVTISPGVIEPYINKREMTTQVGIDSGQTVIIGGLVNDSFNETVNKVPLLGDIPYLGTLFRQTARTKVKTELLLFLTPQVVQSPADLADMTRQLRGEMQHMNDGVEPGLLDHHIRQLQSLKVGQPVLPASVLAPISVPPPVKPPEPVGQKIKETFE